MRESFSSFCDDFYLDMYVNTELELPTSRDTILAFFERVQKQFPSMGTFCRGQSKEYCLEGNRKSGQYRSVTLEADRIVSGYVNCEKFEDAYEQHRLVLELIPYMLSVSHLDITSLDVTMAMEFDCRGNHDEVIAEALGSSGLTCLMDVAGVSVIDYSPSVVIALTPDNRTQGRISIESRTSVFDPRRPRQNDSDDPISLSFTIRQYPRDSEKFDSVSSFTNQCRLIEELMEEKIIPSIVQPLTNIIAQKRLT